MGLADRTVSRKTLQAFLELVECNFNKAIKEIKSCLCKLRCDLLALMCICEINDRVIVKNNLLLVLQVANNKQNYKAE